MRNLQKILALVLALVMSLSLMATAGARDFTDGDQIDETFAESVDVLTGLEVFQGYPTGDFQPKGDITRAEVAAIIYRIATGDVTDSQVGIYADYNKFSDVPSDNWAAGYINYCANAEYIKGRGDGKFYPQDKVTGYEALAMILRVVGYDKNGEFTGADWQVQTAATANQRKVTKNVNAGTLGNPASRETVAELLCQAILIEKVNYTLAFGYQISTDPEDTIAYETFKMEKLEGVVTGNEIADLKTDKGTALGANQTRLVIDGREEVMNIPTGLDDIGECVRVYIRPENGTTRSNLVTSKVYSEGLNKVFTTSERVGSVGNTTGSSEGITSIEGAEHFINFDQADKYEARIRIKYVMQVRMSEYDARLMYRQNGSESNSRLIGIGDATYTAYNTATAADGTKYVPYLDVPNPNTWDTLIRSASGYTFQYEKTIDAFSDLTAQDYSNIKSIFTNGDNTGTWLKGEVYVGTSSKQNQDDVSDDIRWEDFVATYLKAEENKEQVESNGQGCWLKIIDNDNDGIAEYVLQTRYTVAKVAANGTGLDIATLKLTDNNAYNDSCNEVSASDKITVVSGTNLEASEDTVAAGDVVIYAKIDGVIRAQKAESETSRVTTINRSTNPVTATIESGEKKESWVHTHSNGLKSYLTNMVIGTNYTVYFDLYGNIAAYTEGDVGQFTLITDGWFNQTATAREYAVQAYVDGKLQTVNITNNGQLFIQDGGNNNRWGMLKTNFGGNTNATSLNNNGQNMNTIVATLENGNLVPVDKSYRYSQQVVMLDMNENKIPTRDNNATGHVWTTDYVNGTAYKKDSDNSNVQRTSALVLGRSDTVYYYVYKTGTNTVTGAPDYVVRTYTGYNNIPSINPIYIEDVYAVGIETRANNGTVNPTVNYTAEVVVVELNGDYKYVNNSEQVFIPGLTVVNNSVSRTAGYGVETITMIRENGEVADVKVDMSQSTVKYYDIAEGGNRLYAGLYYMSPITTGSDIYRIEPMDAAAIRANNYLSGYVDQANGVLPTDYVRVDVQTTDAKGYPVSLNKDSNGNPLPVGKTVNTENLYTLGYSGNTANLTKAPAATVFNQYPDQGVSDTRIDNRNELWNNDDPATFNGTIGRNEVLVRYSGGSVVWAISFREYSGSGNTNPTRDGAQSVWLQCLPSATATSGVKFYGVGDWVTEADPTGDVDGTLRTITVPYAAAQDTKILSFSEAYAATIGTYTLTKWNAGASDFATPISGLSAEAGETKASNSGGAKYKLVVNFVSGGSETYYLELLPQDPIGTLTSENDGLVRVIDAPDAAYKESLDAAKADAERVSVWVNDPQHINLNQLASLLQYKNGAKEGKIEVAYVENAAGIVETGYNTSIDDVITFVHDEQSAGKIILKVTNYDGLERFVQLKLTTGTANNLPGAKIAAKEAVDSYVDYYLNKVGLNRDILNANMGNPPEIMSGNPATWEAIDKIEWLKENFIEKATTVTETESYMKDNGPNKDPRWADTYIDLSASEAHAALKATGMTSGTQSIKSLISKWIDDIKTANDTLENVKTAAISELDKLANQYQGTAQWTAARAAADEGVAAIKAATSTADVNKAKDAALKAIRNIVTPDITAANANTVKSEIEGDPSNASYSGIENALWYPVVEQDATNRSVLKITGTVGTAAMSSSSEWTNPGLNALFGNWSAAKGDVDSKFPGVTNTKIAVIAFFVGDELQIITIGDKNVEYAKTNTNGLITVSYPNFPNADVITLDVNNVTF